MSSYDNISPLESVSIASMHRYVIPLGTPGTGHHVRPWDNLDPCPKCGSSGYPCIVGNDQEDYHSGAPYRIKCLKCGCSSISSDDISLIMKDWKEKGEIPE